MKAITTLTMNPSVDKSTSTQNVVAEKKLRCQELRREPGGGGINVSRVIKRLGGESIAIFPAGGTNGQMLQDMLTEEGVSQYAVPIKNMTRENFTVYEEATGLQYRFGMPGPELSEAELRRCLNELDAISPRPEYLVISGSLPPGVPDDFYAQVISKARNLGARIILDTSGEALKRALKEPVYLIKPNMAEMIDLAGFDIEDESQQEAAAVSIVDRGQSEIVVVSLGAAGALLVTSDLCERLRAPSVPVKSKVGAGDSMLAAIVFKLAQEKSIHEAISYGVAAGAAAVMSPGTELAHKKPTDRLFQQIISGVRTPWAGGEPLPGQK
ncbi:MAG: 1-phosphofructokinase family hexose kinase [Chloroflexota bacterium]